MASENPFPGLAGFPEECIYQTCRNDYRVGKQIACFPGVGEAPTNLRGLRKNGT
jgi:hypothetical protein